VHLGAVVASCQVTALVLVVGKLRHARPVRPSKDLGFCKIIIAHMNDAEMVGCHVYNLSFLDFIVFVHKKHVLKMNVYAVMCAGAEMGNLL